MKHVGSLLLLLLSLTTAGAAPQIQVQFPLELWQKIEVQKKHRGYIYSFYDWLGADRKEIKYQSASYRTEESGQGVEEQLSERVSADMRPLELNYRSVIAKVETKVRAVFKDNGVLEIEKKTINPDATPAESLESKVLKIKQRPFFGSFIGFLILSNSEALKKKNLVEAWIFDEADVSLKQATLSWIAPQTFQIEMPEFRSQLRVDGRGAVIEQKDESIGLVIKSVSKKIATKGFPLPGEKPKK